MKKQLLLFFLLVLSLGNLRAQFDTDHYIAPYFASTTGYTHGLYFSTKSTTPFNVEIYNNGTVVHTITGLSKNNPQVWIMTTAQAQQYIFASADADALVVTNRGLYTKAVGTANDMRYFVSLRLRQSAHGEFLTSKGKAGLGLQFYAAPAPLTYNSSSMNFTAGVLATENNTTVTVSGYNAGIRFVNGPAANTPPSYTFTLNKGQSVLLAGEANFAANQTGFIGAKITADKPISMTNGNANGMFGTANTTSGSDLILDQSVPVERLGNTFAMVRSLTYLADASNVEGGLVVAKEDNTQIFLNGSATAAATINEGEYYRILSNNYINQGNNHYNMYISTSKPVYLYQLLGTGTSSAGTNTAGYNYIPPLSCYMPREVDEIGFINQMPSHTGSINMKLNILTESGATVTVNGVTPTAVQGPYPVTGNPNWVSYDVPNVTGNLTIVSNKALTAGINGGYSTAGYGGYFAGFSSVPAIVKQTGECIPGLILAVDDIYETYQWFLNGNPIAGANTFQYSPTVPGVYTCTVSISGCAPVTTPEYEVFPCPVNTTLDVNVCGGRTFDVEFSSSTQTVDLNSIVITSQPANGTVAVDNLNGTITYTPNAGYLGPDTFTYAFQSTVPVFFDSESVTVNINVVLLETTDDALIACPFNGVATYDLTTTDVTNYPGATFNYYPTLTDAQNGTNEILVPAAYVSAAGNVFVKVTTPEGCVDYATITLSFYDQPALNDAVMESCFIASSPVTGEFDLSTANVGGGIGATKHYFPSLTDALNNTNQIQNPFVYLSSSTEVFVRVYTANGCYGIAKITLNVILPNYSSVLQDKVICIEDKTTLDAGPGFEAYEWSTGATTQTISNVGVGEYWVILTTDGCKTKQTVRVQKAPEVIINNIDITNNTVTLTVTGGQLPYQYSADGINWQDSNIFTEVPRGQNTFYVKDALDCVPVAVEITVPNLVNVITPNSDGINDFVDYSALRYKKNLTFSVYDRYGIKVHEGNKNNDYRWDGRVADKKVSTGTYWYHISWTEPDATAAPVTYKGWILVKNRE